jgi:hypothetical protein
MSNKERNKDRMELRVSDDFIRAVDAWRRRQPELYPRGTAVKLLCEIALKSESAKEAEASQEKS